MQTDIAVVGAGPYGLSLAAHLAEKGADFRIFGAPMQTWREHMPKGMHLKSDGFASSLSAPDPEDTLGAYCRAHGHPYHDTAIAIPLETFTDYALDFQRRHVPMLDTRQVAKVSADGRHFRLELEEGESLTARQVVLAVGISHFDHVPEVLARAPPNLVSHSSAHHLLDRFKGQDVTVIGAGASALNLVALLHEGGAVTRLVARAPTVKFGTEPGERRPSLIRRLRHPPSGLGPGWRSRIFSDAPHLFRRLPAPLRTTIVRKHLGPSSAWHLKERVVGRVPILTGHTLEGAEEHRGRLRLECWTADKSPVTIETDHVIAATGYRPDLRRLGFLDDGLRDCIESLQNTPVLSPHFEASVPGLYFLGPAAANSFGPLMRFMFGSDFTSRRLSRRLVGA